mmetsp:Transcript_9537/g.19230  ORF Transcript_9537/g.19230 Transcript_9537/m.19230 type:complete len:315 (+) Transcript_9537:92-1036(+)
MRDRAPSRWPTATRSPPTLGRRRRSLCDLGLLRADFLQALGRGHRGGRAEAALAARGLVEVVGGAEGDGPSGEGHRLHDPVSLLDVMVNVLDIVDRHHDLPPVAGVYEPHAVAEPQGGLGDAGPRHEQPADALGACPSRDLYAKLDEARLPCGDGLVSHAEEVQAGVALVVLPMRPVQLGRFLAQGIDQQPHTVRNLKLRLCLQGLCFSALLSNLGSGPEAALPTGGLVQALDQLEAHGPATEGHGLHNAVPLLDVVVGGLHIVHRRHDLPTIAGVDEPHTVAQAQGCLGDARPRHEQPTDALAALSPTRGLDP